MSIESFPEGYDPNKEVENILREGLSQNSQEYVEANSEIATTRIGDWLKSGEQDHELEEKVRSSEQLQEVVRQYGLALEKFQIITAEQCNARFDLVGIKKG